MPAPEVDFVVTCYERTYRDVLSPGWFSAAVAQHRFPFARRVALVNNTLDPQAAGALAEARRIDGEIDLWYAVADRLPEALRRTGLAPRHIKRLPHFTDCCLVAVCLPGPDWVCYWDADAKLERDCDWVSPTVEFMLDREDVAVGEPNDQYLGCVEREAIGYSGDFALRYGLCDVAFLVRRQEFARPIYRLHAPASWRYPLAPIGALFDQRADAYLRRRGRLRATYRPVRWQHLAPVGLNYGEHGVRERVRHAAQLRLGRAAAAISDHPAMRAWPR